MEEAHQFWDQVNLGVIETENTEEGRKMLKLNKFGAIAKAGVATGDVLQEVNGVSVVGWEFEDMMEPYIAAGLGAKVPHTFSRGGRRYVVDVELKKKRTLSFDVAEVDADLERKIAP